MQAYKYLKCLLGQQKVMYVKDKASYLFLCVYDLLHPKQPAITSNYCSYYLINWNTSLSLIIPPEFEFVADSQCI